MNTAVSPAHLSRAFRILLLWAIGASLLTLFVITTLSAAYADGQYIPAHNDAFYHARRILDVVMTGQPIAQFDARMHVPEGSWVTWPWSYDAAMAAITGWFGPYPDRAAASAVLMRIPMVVGVFAVGVVVWLAQLLRLRFVPALLLVIGYVCLPGVNANFAIGNVDHHFAEGLWASLVMCAGIAFFRAPGSLASAIALGLVLGSAVGVHESLFMLQVPVVAFYLVEWLRGSPPLPRRTTLAMAAALLVSTLALCLPSGPLQQGFFEFYTLSWFHVYIACGTCAFVIMPTLLPRRPLQIAALFVAGGLATIPLLTSANLGLAFLGGSIDTIQDILEVYSPYRIAIEFSQELSAPELLNFLWLAAPAVLASAYFLVKERDPGLRFFALFAIMGLILLQLQSRLQVFGELALIAVPMLVLNRCLDRWAHRSFAIAGLGCAAFLLLMMPVRHRLGVHWLLAGAHGYAEIRGVFPVLSQQCREKPGIVLADTEAGHWIRYHSDCSVIGNLFLLTPQQAAKARQVDAMMQLSPAELASAQPQVTYVLAYHNAVVDPRQEPDLEELRRRLPRLEGALLGPIDALGPGYRLIWSLSTPGGQTYARLFEVSRVQ